MEKEFYEEIEHTRKWFKSERFAGITRFYSPRQVVEQRGTIRREYSIAKKAAEEFHEFLRASFKKGHSITTFGPYSPGQAVMIKRQGIKGIYLGGWATSAKGSADEDPGADLASYPLSRVPDEAAAIVRALVAADKNQYFTRARMSDEQAKNTPVYDYRPFIIADADTGHGGDAHVRNLIKRFVEAGVPGYHIEDQKPGAKKCGHQGGKVLVTVDEQIKRLNTARFQLDLMEVPGIIVARTDAESATLLESIADERDHPFVLGSTNPETPAFKICYLYILKTFYEQGFEDINGHLIYNLAAHRFEDAESFFKETGIATMLQEKIAKAKSDKKAHVESILDDAIGAFGETWENHANVKTFGEAVFEVLKTRLEEDMQPAIDPADWLKFAKKVPLDEARKKALSVGIDVSWDPEKVRTPDGYYQVKGSIEYAIARSLAVAPFTDLIWMETKTADLKDAKEFAEAIHQEFPNAMLAYNLSPSFNWDTTGMSDEQMKAFPTELGKMGFVFNFITYGGHQIDGLASEEFALALQQNGMLALATLQRRLRLIDSPYKTPQSWVGGNRFDAALTASLGNTSTTRAMGKGSTQTQHLVPTEFPIKTLDRWLAGWLTYHKIMDQLHARLRPVTGSSDLLELSVCDQKEEKIASVIFTGIQDRQGRNILSIRNQSTKNIEYRKKRLMTLMQSFLVHRYKSDSIHYLAPTEDNHRAVEGMKKLGFFSEVKSEVGDIIVANVNKAFQKKLLEGDAEIQEMLARN